jgi:hypothetical protein
MTGTSPVPLTIATEENVHAEGFFNSQVESVQPAGIASPLHYIWNDNQEDNIS